MVSRLVALDGTIDIPLNSKLIIVGRHPSCDISLDSVRISRVHCCIFKDDGKLFVRDLNSTNGVSVNNQIVTTGLITDQSVLSIAHLRFRYVARPTQISVTSEMGGGEPVSEKKEPGSLQFQDPVPPLGSSSLSAREMEKAIRAAIAPVAGSDRCQVEVNIRWQKSDEIEDVRSPKAAI